MMKIQRKAEIINRMNRSEDEGKSLRDNMAAFYMSETGASRERAASVADGIVRGAAEFSKAHARFAKLRDGVEAEIADDLEKQLKDMPLPRQYAVLRNIATALSASESALVIEAASEYGLSERAAHLTAIADEWPLLKDEEVGERDVASLRDDIAWLVTKSGSLSLVSLLSSENKPLIGEYSLARVARVMSDDERAAKAVASVWDDPNAAMREALVDYMLYEEGLGGYPEGLTPEMCGLRSATRRESARVHIDVLKGYVTPEVGTMLLSKIAAAALTAGIGVGVFAAACLIFEFVPGLTLSLILTTVAVLLGCHYLETSVKDFGKISEAVESGLAKFPEWAREKLAALIDWLRARFDSLAKRFAFTAQAETEEPEANVPEAEEEEDDEDEEYEDEDEEDEEEDEDEENESEKE